MDTIVRHKRLLIACTGSGKAKLLGGSLVAFSLAIPPKNPDLVGRAAPKFEACLIKPGKAFGCRGRYLVEPGHDKFTFVIRETVGCRVRNLLHTIQLQESLVL